MCHNCQQLQELIDTFNRTTLDLARRQAKLDYDLAMGEIDFQQAHYSGDRLEIARAIAAVDALVVTQLELDAELKEHNAGVTGILASAMGLQPDELGVLGDLLGGSAGFYAGPGSADYVNPPFPDAQSGFDAPWFGSPVQRA